MNNQKSLSTAEAAKININEMYKFLSSTLMYVVLGTLAFFTLLSAAGFIGLVIDTVSWFTEKAIAKGIYGLIFCLLEGYLMLMLVYACISTLKLISSANNQNQNLADTYLQKLCKILHNMMTFSCVTFVLCLIFSLLVFEGAVQGIFTLFVTATFLLLFFLSRSLINFVESVERRVHSPAIAVSASCIDAAVLCFIACPLIVGIPLGILAIKFHRLDMKLGTNAYMAVYSN